MSTMVSHFVYRIATNMVVKSRSRFPTDRGPGTFYNIPRTCIM